MAEILMIIDKNNAAHAHIPASLDGEILLEEVAPENGGGFITCSQEVGRYVLSLTPPEREAMGYGSPGKGVILDNLADTLAGVPLRTKAELGLE